MPINIGYPKENLLFIDQLNRKIYMNLLFVTSSPSTSSLSTRLGHLLCATLPSSQKALHLNLNEEPVPFYTTELHNAIFKGSVAPDDVEARKQSEAYIQQFESADRIVLAVPMHNFSVPAVLKAWMDQLAIPGRTFDYQETGPRGLLDKKVFIVLTSGGKYQGSPWQAMDSATPTLINFFKYLGCSPVVYHVEGTAGKLDDNVESALTATFQRWLAQ